MTGRSDPGRPRLSFRQKAEGVALKVFVAMLRPLPINWVSTIGSGIGRLMGVVAGRRRNERIARNLAWLRPDDDPRERRRRHRKYWRHLGRCLTEYAVLDRLLPAGRIHIHGEAAALARNDAGLPILLYSLHIGYWEVTAISPNVAGRPTPVFFRPPRNPVINEVVGAIRSRAGMTVFPKDRYGTIAAVRHFQKPGSRLGMLIDERTHHQIQVPSFGRPIIGTTALHSLSRIARRHPCCVVPACTIRRDGGHFDVYCGEPIMTGPESDEAELLSRIDRIAESWVRDVPEQWLWLPFWQPPPTS
ncbi:MAG: lysophospholipid acyltransferase family protein [Azospirillaceae bacterium]